MSKVIVKKKKTTLRNKHDTSVPRVEIIEGELQVNDLKVQLFIQHFLDPHSDTFANVRGSAIRAKFAESYADNLLALMPEWLKTVIGFYRDKHERMVAKAERNLEEILDMDITVQAMGAFGPIYNKKEKMVTKTLKNGKKKKVKVVEKIPVMVRDSKILKIKSDVSKYTTERLFKKKYGNQAQTANIFNTFNLTPEQMRKVAKEFTLPIHGK